MARRQGERGHEAYALRLLGEIASRACPAEAEKADALYREAMVLAEELGMRPLRAHCLLGLGRLYRRLADHKKAKQQLGAAAALYREMGMSHWLAQAEAEISP